MICGGEGNLAQKQTMKNAGNGKSLESIYKNGRICFQEEKWSNVLFRHNVSDRFFRESGTFRAAFVKR